MNSNDLSLGGRHCNPGGCFFLIADNLSQLMHSYSNQPTKYQVCASGARCLSVIAVPVLQGCCETRTWPKAAIERLANWALGF